MAINQNSGENEPGVTFVEFGSSIGASGVIYSTDKKKISTYFHGDFEGSTEEFAATLREIADWVDANSK